MSRINELEKKLRKLILSRDQAKVVSMIFGLDGKSCHRIVDIAQELYHYTDRGVCGSISNYRNAAFQKLGKSFELSEADLAILCQLDPSYEKLFSMYHDKNTIQVRMQNFQARRYSHFVPNDELGFNIGALVPLDKDVQVLDALFGFNGKKYLTQREVINEIYFDGEADNITLAKEHYRVRDIRLRSLPKIEKAWLLSEQDYSMLVQCCSFYQRLRDFFKDQPFTEIKKALWAVGHPYYRQVGVDGSASKAVKVAPKNSLERNLNKLCLSDKEKQVMTRLLRMDGNQRVNLNEIAESVYSTESLKGDTANSIVGRVRSLGFSASKKIERAFNLSSIELELLCQFDEWYLELVKIFPEKSIEKVKIATRKVKKQSERRKDVKRYYFEQLKTVPKEQLSHAIELLPPNEKELIGWALGLENSDLSRKEMAQKLEVNYFRLNYPLIRIAAKLCHCLLGIKIKSKDYYGGLGQKYQEDILGKRESKKRFLGIKETELWNKISPAEREAVILYYGLDLPENDMRVAKDAGEILGLSQKAITASVRHAKRRLMAIDPSLGFPLSENQAGLVEILKVKDSGKKLKSILLSQDEIRVISEVLFSGDKYKWLPQIADYLGISKDRLGWLKYNATRKLKAFLDILLTEEFSIADLDPWYSKFNDFCSDKSWDDIKSLINRWKRRSNGSVRERVPADKTKYGWALDVYRREVLSIPELSDEETASLIMRIKDGEQEAVDSLYRASLRYILPVAYSQTHSMAGKEKGLDIMDLIQEGNLGVWQACLKMNHNGNNHWVAYVKATAKYAMKRAINESMPNHLILIDDKKRQLSNRFIKVTLDMKEKLGYNPSIEEISQEMGMELEQAWDIQKAMQLLYVPNSSLNGPITQKQDNEDSQSTLGDIIPDEEAWNPYKEPEKSKSSIVAMFRDYAQSVLDGVLSPVEQSVLRFRYGFEDSEYYSWPVDKVARALKITESMVRLIEQEALDKLRSDSRVVKRIGSIIKVENKHFSLPIETFIVNQKEKTDLFNLKDPGPDQRWENSNIKPEESPKVKLLLHDEQSRHLYKQGLIPALSWYQKR